MDGWIKIHSKILEWEWHDIPEMFSLWLHLLLLANGRDKTWRGIMVPRGSFVTSRASLSKIVGISEQRVRTCLARLKSTNEITIKSTSKYTMITICKYDTYQLVEDDQQPTINQQDNHQITTTIDNIVLSKESISKDISSLSNTRAFDNSDSLDYARIRAMWKETCPSLNAVRIMTESRKRQVALRVKEMKAAYPGRDVYDVMHDFFAKVEASDFLKGGGSQGWKADFDWLFSNDRRWVKVMEGGFDNTGQKARGGALLDVNSLWDV